MQSQDESYAPDLFARTVASVADHHQVLYPLYRFYQQRLVQVASLKHGPCNLIRVQIVQDIAVRLNSDLDFSSMMKTSPTLYSILHPEETNCIWRQRFMARYDYPHLESTFEFPFAYKVRQLVLQRFDAIAIAHSLKQRSGHQLDVIKDMVLGKIRHDINTPPC